ncbi:hypothetical protein O1611_g657 [Lasiodiplodia mahajangana]|uniref:Uncharacterized protein n=1 Tax=Lasiodiplodia mahajangana TaxID=1108764 RepID=A0ACC2K093_9PEZI|nr:hypothetical protein O1611_g657 [Lasiodiplodia mahajangana]
MSEDIHTQNNRVLAVYLHAAAQEGREDVITALINYGTELHALTEDGYTPLHVATIRGKAGSTERLIQLGANLEFRERNLGSTPLHCAAQEGHIDIVRILSNHGANLQALRDDGLTPLHIAAYHGHTATVEELIQRGADPNSNCMVELGRTALHIAVQRGHEAVSKVLIEKFGTKMLELVDNQGAMALHLAASTGQDAMVRLLLESGSDPNAETEDGLTPLHYAVRASSTTITALLLSRTRITRSYDLLAVPAQNGQESILRMLLNHGINANAKNTEGASPLHYAAEKGQFFATKLLIQHSADVQALTNRDLAPLDFADRYGHQEVVDILARHGAKRYRSPLNHNDKSNNSIDHSALRYLKAQAPYVFKHGIRIFILREDDTLPLHHAASHGRETAVADLIRDGANPMERRSEDGATPLHLAAQNNRLSVVEFLLSHGAEANTKTVDGTTALHYAAYYGHKEVLMRLIDHRADLETPNEDGMRALHLAAQNGHESIVDHLIKSGADSTGTDPVGAMPLHLAAEAGHEMAAEILISAGTTVNITTNEGITPLHLAAKNGHLATLQLLITHYAYVRAPARISGITALDLAAWNGHKEAMGLLVNSNGAKDMSRSDQNPTPDRALCNLCRELDFVNLFNEPRDSSIELGTVADIKSRNCMLCTMILQYPLSKTHYQKHRDSILEDSDYLRFSFEFRRGVSVLNANFFRPVKRIRSVPSMEGMPLGSRRFYLQSKNRSHHGQNSSPADRRILPRYNSRLIGNWINKCITCQSTGVGNGKIESAWRPFIQRLIDVENECLVEVPEIVDSPKARVFAALSYVWGGGQKTTLTRATYDKFHTAGSLTPKDESISRTIRHAIVLCKDLGMKFLWVDALCIQQDDQEGKMEQIVNMPYVYANAQFTIVAGSGNDANAGLCGLLDSDYERQSNVPIRQDYTLVLEALPLPNAIGTTYWSTRAWTYQEFLLSPRRIFFSDSAVYFSCEHGIFQEGVLSEHRFPTPQSAQLEEHVLSGYQPDWERQWFAYAELVSEYTRRNLTDQADALLAFTAPIKVLSEIYKDPRFLWAIPLSYRHAGLLWRRCLGCEKCSNSTNGLPKRGNIVVPPTTDRKRAPSWSWISRQGHVEYSSWLVNGDPDLTIIPRVNWLEEQSGDGNMLYFEADIATFLILGRHFSDLQRQGAGDFIMDGGIVFFGQDTGDPLAVYDLRTGHRCGVIYDDEQMDLPASYTLVKLSQTCLREMKDEHQLEPQYHPANLPHGPGRDPVSHIRANTKFEKEGDKLHQFFDYEAYDCGKKWPVYNVLVVRWKSETVAERIGVGKVHVDAFDNADTFRRVNFYLV